MREKCQVFQGFWIEKVMLIVGKIYVSKLIIDSSNDFVRLFWGLYIVLNNLYF